MSARRPDPQWHIVVDSWLSLPYPDWYSDYFLAHFQPELMPLPFLGAFAAATAADGSATDTPDEVLCNHSSPDSHSSWRHGSSP